MSLIVIVLVLAFFGFLSWLILNGFLVLLWLIQTLGVNTGPLPHIRFW